MTTGVEELKQDLNIVAAMSQDMRQYLNSEVLFWPLSIIGYPKLTLGSFLMRIHRLQKLVNLLDSQESHQLSAITDDFYAFASQNIVKVETKGHEELDARVRQWEQLIKDYNFGADFSVATYKTDAQVRVMITALLQNLQSAPYKLDPEAQITVEGLDKALRKEWQTGAFIWHEVWQPAYPKTQYWWLYGMPKDKVKS